MTSFIRPKSHSVSITSKRCQIQIQINDDESIRKDHEIETYFKKLIQITKFSGLLFSPTGSRIQWILNGIVNTIVIVVVTWMFHCEMKVVSADGLDVDIEISTMLCGILWTVQSLISMTFIIWWQINGQLWCYIASVSKSQKGECIADGVVILKRSIYIFRLVNVALVLIVGIYHYGPAPFDIHSKYEFFQNPILRFLQCYSTIHLFVCWNLSLFLFNILIDGAYLEVRYFNNIVSMLDGDNEQFLKEELLRLISRHSEIVKAIRRLDNLFRVYAFTMIATMIPTTLLSLIMLAHRVDDYVDLIILGLPSLGITVYGFLGLTLAPARLYEEMYSSKNCLCQNLKVWQPHRADVYQIATVLGSHMEQPNMGLTIWGFAVLSKPLILATFSGMIMMLSLLLDIVPTIEEIVEEAEEHNNLLNMTLNSG